MAIESRIRSLEYLQTITQSNHAAIEAKLSKMSNTINSMIKDSFIRENSIREQQKRIYALEFENDQQIKALTALEEKFWKDFNKNYN